MRKSSIRSGFGSIFRGLLVKFVSIAVPVFLIVNLAFLYVYSHYRLDAIRSELAAEMATLSFRLAKAVAKPLADSDGRTAKSMLQTLAGNRSVRCALLKKTNGSLLAAWPFPGCANIETANKPVVVPVVHRRQGVGNLVVTYDESWVRETFGKELGYIAAAIVFASLVAFGASVVAHRLTIGRPVGQLIAAIRRRGRDGGHQLVAWRSGDELGQVIAVYNAMTKIEGKRRRQLERTTEDLRHEIEERAKVEADLRAAQGQLMQASKLEAIGTLAAGVAHEINTPLQYVTNNLAFLKDSFDDLDDAIVTIEKAGQPDSAAIGKALEEADLEYLREEVPLAITQGLEGLKQVAKIVQAVKQFSHPEQSEKQEFDLGEAVRNAIEVSKNQWKYVAALDCEIAEGLPTVLGYPGSLRQVVLNLIVNAAQAIEMRRDEAHEGRIGVVVRESGAGIEISVSDNGVGIPAEHRDRIFEMFFTTKAPGEGTGQGLAICQSIIANKHGGQILIDSEEGVGTTFMVRLPTALQEAA